MATRNFLLLTIFWFFFCKAAVAVYNGTAADKADIVLKIKLKTCGGDTYFLGHGAYYEHHSTSLNYLRKYPTYEEEIIAIALVPCSIVHGISDKDLVVTANNLKFIDTEKKKYRFVTNRVTHPQWDGKYSYDACALVLDRIFYGVLSVTIQSTPPLVNDIATVLSYGTASPQAQFAPRLPFSAVLLKSNYRLMNKGQCIADYQLAGLGEIPNVSNFCIPRIICMNDLGAPIMRNDADRGMLYMGSVSSPGVCGCNKKSLPGIVTSSNVFYRMLMNLKTWHLLTKSRPYQSECHKCCRETGSQCRRPPKPQQSKIRNTYTKPHKSSLD